MTFLTLMVGLQHHKGRKHDAPAVGLETVKSKFTIVVDALRCNV